MFDPFWLGHWAKLVWICLFERIYKNGKSQNICTKIDAAILLEFQLGAN